MISKGGHIMIALMTLFETLMKLATQFMDNIRKLIGEVRTKFAKDE